MDARAYDTAPTTQRIAVATFQTDVFTNYSEGEKDSGASGTLLADTGQLAAGHYRVLFTFDQAWDADVTIQHRNAANSATVFPHACYLKTRQPHQRFMTFQLVANERIRVVSAATITAKTSVTIGLERVP